MNAKTTRQENAAGEHSEILILAGGKILAHNITPVMAQVLSELNPEDAAMSRRAGRTINLNFQTDELSN
ncbi:MAG: hypothetical protein P4N60_22835 [Verrucomicrobiae bacterium]|nr:hypothetical protein [Verrucomicrobiae bacterium]